MKRRLDPNVISWIKEIVNKLPRLTKEEVVQLVPMFMSDDSEVRDCASELVYQTN